MGIGEDKDGDNAAWIMSRRAGLITCVLHVLLLAALSVSRVPVSPPVDIKFVPVTVVADDRQAKPKMPSALDPSSSNQSAPPPPAPAPVNPPRPDVTPPAVAPVPVTPPPISSAPPELVSERPAQSGEAAAAPSVSPDALAGEYAGSRWALKPPLAAGRLEGLGFADDVDCLQSLSEDCADMRKEVFAEYQMSETDKIWTERRADAGMSSAFYGLSEREIRLKLGTKIAGENGLMILPGIGIDGQLWDMLHGVKKGCEMKRGINSAGKYDVVRVCPDSQPAARDKRFYIPPKDAP